MIRIKRKSGKIFLSLENSGQIIIDSLADIQKTIIMLESDEELDFHHRRAIIDRLESLRYELIRHRENKCIRDSSSIHSSKSKRASY